MVAALLKQNVQLSSIIPEHFYISVSAIKQHDSQQSFKVLTEVKKLVTCPRL